MYVKPLELCLAHAKVLFGVDSNIVPNAYVIF